MKYIIIDLEATCWEHDRTKQNEIIEIGAVCVDENKQTISEFNYFVKPIINSQLSGFCINLTSIQQKQVDEANIFPIVFNEFHEWILAFEDDYLLCSWRFYDQTQLKNDCELHSINTDWLTNHISLKHQYAIIKNTRSMGMKSALKNDGIELEGTHHRGIDDAKNITKIFLKQFEKWDFEKRRE